MDILRMSLRENFYLIKQSKSSPLVSSYEKLKLPI